MSKILNIINPIAEQACRELGYVLWYTEFVKEGPGRFLRIYIDKEGGIGIADCERMSNFIDPLIDSADPIDVPYHLEISSPGIERKLITREHFDMYIGEDVQAKLYAAIEPIGKTLVGRLLSCELPNLTILPEGGLAALTINIKDAKNISVKANF